MTNDELKQELIRLMRSSQPKAKAYISNATKGYSYLEIQRRNQKVEIPIVDNFTVTRSLNF